MARDGYEAEIWDGGNAAGHVVLRRTHGRNIGSTRMNTDSTSELAGYPFVERLITGGFTDSLDALLSGGKWVTVCDEGGQLIMFDKQGIDSKQALDKLERYAKVLLEDGVTNVEINGVRQRIS